MILSSKLIQAITNQIHLIKIHDLYLHVDASPYYMSEHHHLLCLILDYSENLGTCSA